MILSEDNMGKGSNPRPFSVDKDTYRNNFDRIFGKKNENSNTIPGQDQSPTGNDPRPSQAPTANGTESS